MKLLFLLFIFSGFYHFSFTQVKFTKITDATNPIVSERDNFNNSNTYLGASWIDFDNDGDLDLFVNLLGFYINQGQEVFKKISPIGISGITNNPDLRGMGHSWSDYDNDGDLDCYLATSSGSGLYENNGKGVFSIVTTGEIGMDTNTRGWSCAWSDIDLDGHTDLAITVPFPDDKISNVLWQNQKNGLFKKLNSPISESLDAFTVGTWADYDDDGDPDYFIATGNISKRAPDYLFKNKWIESQKIEFEKITTAPIATDLLDGQLWNWVDIDNDGDLDAYVTNYTGGTSSGMTNNLYIQVNGQFQKKVNDPIVTDIGISLSSIWSDYDNDGDQDCIVGYDQQIAPAYYENNGQGSFTKITNTEISQEARLRRGASAGDYNNDGKMDLYMIGRLPFLYKNVSDNGFHWIKFNLVGTRSNKSAIGAKIKAYASIAGKKIIQLKELSAQNTFQGHNSFEIHFGLRESTVVDSVIIEWPSGGKSVLKNLDADKLYRIVEDAVVPLSVNEANIDFITIYPNPSHQLLRIELKKGWMDKLNILDMNGVIITQLNLNKNKIATIDMSKVSIGNYILMVTTDRGVFSKLISKNNN